MNNLEIWKDIPGYENAYQISNLNRVKSLNFNRTGNEKILIPFTNATTGTQHVKLCKNGVYENCNIQKLVSEIFGSETERRYKMNMISKIYDIISNLIDTMMEKTITPIDECKIGNKFYINNYIPNIIDAYYRDIDVEKITILLDSLTLDDIRFIRILLTNNDIEGAIEYLSKKFGYDDLSSEFYNTYKRSKNSEIDLLKAENAELKKENERLKAELKKYTINTNIKFTRDNITKSSIMNAKVKVLNGEYSKEYTTFKEALDGEMIYEEDIKGGFDNVVSLIKARLNKNPDSAYGMVITNTGYRINIYFEN